MMGTTVEKLQAVVDSKNAIKNALIRKEINPGNRLDRYAGEIDSINAVTFAESKQFWRFTGFNNSIICIDVDKDGYCYATDYDRCLRKISPDGAQVFSYSSTASCVAVDDDGYMFVGISNSVSKRNNSNSSVWNCRVPKDVKCIAVESGYVYASSEIDVSKIDQYGKIEWTYNAEEAETGYDRCGMAVDKDGYVYLATTGSFGHAVEKIDPSGKQVWRHILDTHLNQFKIATDRYGNVYAALGVHWVYKISNDGETSQELYTDGYCLDVSVFEIEGEYAGTITYIYCLIYHEGQGSKIMSLTDSGDLHDDDTFITSSYGNVMSVGLDKSVYLGDSYGNVTKVEKSSLGSLYMPSNQAKRWDVYDIQENLVELSNITPSEVMELYKISRTGSVSAIAIDDDGYIYMCVQGDRTIRKYDNSGYMIWSFNGGVGAPFGVDVDAEGYIYAGYVTLVGDTVADDTLRKISPDGKEIWKYTSNEGIYWVAVNNNDGVFAAISGNKILLKLNKSGRKMWDYITPGYVGGASDVVVVDINDNAYCAGNDNLVKKINNYGRHVWLYSGHTAEIFGLAVDKHGYVYSASDDYSVRKISPDGKEIWKFTGHTNYANRIVVDSAGNSYSTSSDKTVRKINSAGAQVWSLNMGYAVYAIAADNAGYIYVTTEDGSVTKIQNNMKLEKIAYFN